MTKIVVAALTAGLIAALPFSCDNPSGPEQADSTDKLAYVNPTGDEFPILAWYSLLGGEVTTERYEEMREAGFNISFSHFESVEQLEQAFNACKGTGVKLMAHCSALEDHTSEVVEKFKNEEDLAGWFLRDEPVVSQFPALREFRDRILQSDSSHILYLNLLPSIVEPAVLGAKDYEEYAQGFVDDINLNQLSYDFYPVVVEGADTLLRPQFYQNLEIMRKVAIRNDQPFWAFALSTAHDPYPIPTSEHLRIEAISALAYGAQCLQYFTYTTPGTEVWNFHNAPIDEKSQKTDVWYLIKELNQEIHNLTWVFLGAKAVDVSHTGEEIPMDTKQLESLPKPFTSIETDGPGLLVSCLENDGKSFLMVVNRDLHASQKVGVAHDKKVRRILPDGSSAKEKPEVTQATLAPGDYLLFQY